MQAVSQAPPLFKICCGRQHSFAVLLEPHTACELNQDQIRALVDELIDAHGDYMKDYR